MRIFLAFLVLTVFLTAAIIYTYYVRRGVIMYEGFSEEDISSVEKAVSEAVPQIEPATIAKVLTILKRMAGTVLQPGFFTDAIRRSQMSPMDMARDYIKSQAAAAQAK